MLNCVFVLGTLFLVEGSGEGTRLINPQHFTHLESRSCEPISSGRCLFGLLPDVGPQRLGEIGPGQTVVEALQSCEAEAMQEVVDSGE